MSKILRIVITRTVDPKLNLKATSTECCLLINV